MLERRIDRATERLGSAREHDPRPTELGQERGTAFGIEEVRGGDGGHRMRLIEDPTGEVQEHAGREPPVDPSLSLDDARGTRVTATAH